jgi:pimeloyl-ACP methyl ester carboxylesterase
MAPTGNEPGVNTHGLFAVAKEFYALQNFESMTVEKTLRFNNGNIFYRVTGDGPAVLLLHGIPATGDLWSNQVKALATFKCIIPDLPGSGKSEMITEMSIEGMAESIKAILDNENISVVTLIGHSIGGYISLAFAHKYPERLNGLGLFHSTAYPDREERKVIRRNGIESIKAHGAHEFLKTLVPNLFSAQSKEGNATQIQELIASTENFSSPALISYYEAMIQRPDSTTVLNNSEIPVLFVAGIFDSAIPLDDVLQQCHLPLKSYFHILAVSGHLGMVEEQEKANSILNDYLADLQ